MRLSTDRISHLAHLLKDGIKDSGLAEFRDEGVVLRVVKDTITRYCQLDEQADQVVRKKLASMSGKVPEGSREWDVLYQKFFEQEMNRLFR